MEEEMEKIKTLLESDNSGWWELLRNASSSAEIDNLYMAEMKPEYRSVDTFVPLKCFSCHFVNLNPVIFV